METIVEERAGSRIRAAMHIGVRAAGQTRHVGPTS